MTNMLATLDKWVVSDVPGDLGQAEFVFILESPHTAELRTHYPAAGTAGKAMAKFLTGSNARAFGPLIAGGATGSKYGIVNVCPVPMQALAYAGALNPEQQEIVRQLGLMRNPERKSIDAALYAEVLENFSHRLARTGSTARIIPCGKFARKALAGVRAGNTYDIPHPSFGNWHKKKYKAAMEQLKEEICPT